MAVQREAEAKEHKALAAQYTKNPQAADSKHPMPRTSADNCKFFAEHCRNAAKEMRAMAADHEAMAKAAGK